VELEKGPDAYRTISEVADDLDLPQHVLRFWETRFAQIKPLKRGGGRRYYRPDDIDLLRGIRHLLYGEGYTIRGVQQILREQGARHVQSLGRAAAEEGDAAPDLADAEEAHAMQGAVRAEPARLVPAAEGAARARREPAPPEQREEDLPPLPFRGGDPEIPEAGRAPTSHADRERARRDQMAAARAAEEVRFSSAEIRVLKATLFELGECRRILDGVARERS
jgi:DNA-binding transcriptional MerR regulator